tara:strand:+ start:1429 stop:2262 length:834 start_codon:yes stop_codon:yes gene_type:complete
MNPSDVNVVLYHAKCSDGMGAAYAAWKLLGNRAEYIPCAHGNLPPDVVGKNVAILDFSFPNAITKQMIEDANSLLIIDHHKSAVVELHDISETIFDMNSSGATMAWNYFHPDKTVPKFIQYITDRDLWRFELPYSKEFSRAFDMVPFEFEEFEKFEDDSVFDDAVKRGSYILAYTKTVVKTLMEKASKRKLRGHDVLVINSQHLMSELGAAMAMKADLAVIWFYDHHSNRTKVSLRGQHAIVDASEIARSFGGGGHPNASGFIIKGMDIEGIFDVEE